jgi:hypothetical protein
MDRKRLNRKMVVWLAAQWVVGFSFFGFASFSFGGGVKMSNSKVLKIRIETIHFGSPQIKNEKRTIEILKITEGSEIDLASSQFKVKHRLKVDLLTSKTVQFSETKPIHKKSGLLLPHVKDKIDNKGFSLTKSEQGYWQKEINKEQVLILVQTGIQGAGVQWEISMLDEK